MSGRIRAITGHTREPLSADWELSSCPAGTVDGPSALEAARLTWVPTVVPSTVAASLRRAGSWSPDVPGRRFDADDWWYRARFTTEPSEPGEEMWIRFEGLATLAEVWLNGAVLLSSEGMFTAHECGVDGLVRHDNELLIRFRSLEAALAVRRPRPRWRAPMVENQQLRWFRTTLLGRAPGWSPAAGAVGPWREITLERRRGANITNLSLTAGADGTLDVRAEFQSLHGGPVTSPVISLERDGRVFRAALNPERGHAFRGRLVVPKVERWWPHTHGTPALYSVRLRAAHSLGPVEADLGTVGFRSVTLATDDDDFAIHLNGVPVFCRGACWTPPDPVSLSADEDALDRAFQQVVAAGMNMLRVSGAMVYESDAFLDRCDASGVLLWQDFMFANLDYPGDDPQFVARVTEEGRQVLARLQGRPSLAVLCGNSEVEQQAAMFAAPRDRWTERLFSDVLPTLVRDLCPDVPYVPSSAHGGSFPHQGNVGSTSYFGVGAYMRSLEDARRAEVRFASECLAFANIPDARSLALLPGAGGTRVHHPAWKAGSPRDLGAGWDFDDIRDHYLERLFRIDSVGLRYSDHERYLAMSRVVTGEVMAAVFSEWRRKRSVTRGGLVWFLRDLARGAGWGLVDSDGTPKAAWHYVRRALAPQAVMFSDEGCNGMYVHVVNDRGTSLAGELEVVLFRDGEVRTGRGAGAIRVAPHAAMELNAATLFDGFLDLSYAYRFGPTSHDSLVATVRDVAGRVVARAFHFVLGLPNVQTADVGLGAEVRAQPDGSYDVLVRSRKFAQSVEVDVAGFESSENYFHVAPGGEQHLKLLPAATSRSLRHVTRRGTLRALNAESSATLVLVPK